jgi:hypothetical protein
MFAWLSTSAFALVVVYAAMSLGALWTGGPPASGWSGRLGRGVAGLGWRGVRRDLEVHRRRTSRVYPAAWLVVGIIVVSVVKGREPASGRWRT